MEEENVQVVLRLRPLSDKERRSGEENVWKVYEGVSIVLRREVEDGMPVRKFTSAHTAFNFDRCFGTAASNELVYEATIKHMIDSAVNGINATVFMYGQTGSGKTFTMLGYDQKKGVYNKGLADEAKRSASQNKKGKDGAEATYEHKMKQHLISEELIEDTRLENKTGLLIQALRDLFTKIKNSGDKTFFVKCSYVEIYNDQIYDLLQRAENIGETLQVCEDSARDQFFVRGVREEAIDDWTDAIDKLKRGEINRHYARTMMNHSSSRSHTIFRVYIQSLVSSFTGKTSNGPAYVTESWFNFVDLAGSEKVSNHDQIEEGNKLQQRVKEGKHINKSLFFLTQVIKLKSEGKKSHIPYRNSPLTKILRSSLGGNSRTAIVLCANPTYAHLEQTLSTIRFGLSAKKIQNRISANVVTRDDDEAVRIMIADYEKKLRDNEKDREMLRDREKKMMQRILGLEKRTVDWARKMKDTQSLKFADIAEAIPQTAFDDLLMDYKKYGQSHMTEAGIIMFPIHADTRYSGFCNLMRKKVIETARLQDGRFGDFDEECLHKAYHSSSGRHAMRSLEDTRVRVGYGLEIYELIKRNWIDLDFTTQMKETESQSIEMAGLMRSSVGRLEQVSAMWQESKSENKNLQERVRVLEGRGLKRLTDEELEIQTKIAEETLARFKQEQQRRQILQTITDAQAQLGLTPQQLKGLSTIFGDTEDEVEQDIQEEEEEEKQIDEYVEGIREQCRQDLSKLTKLQVPTAPDKEELSAQLFQGCDELVLKSKQFRGEVGEYWKQYLSLVQNEHGKLKELMSAQKEPSRQKPDDLKSVWLDVDEILNRDGKIPEDESDNKSVSDISHRPTKPRNTNDHDADHQSDSEDEEWRETEFDEEEEEGGRTPRMGAKVDDEDEEIYKSAEEESEEEERYKPKSRQQYSSNPVRMPSPISKPLLVQEYDSHRKHQNPNEMQRKLPPSPLRPNVSDSIPLAINKSASALQHKVPARQSAGMDRKPSQSPKPLIRDSSAAKGSPVQSTSVKHFALPKDKIDQREKSPAFKIAKFNDEKRPSSPYLGGVSTTYGGEMSVTDSLADSQGTSGSRFVLPLSQDPTLAELLKHKAIELKNQQRRGRALRSGKKTDDDYGG